MKPLATALIASAVLTLLPPTLRAQDILLDWDSSWSHMHPFNGALPAGSGATTPHSGATPWFAAEAQFNASYTGPSFTVAGVDFDAGLSEAPFGYGTIDYLNTPNPVPGEFGFIGTQLTLPASGSRYTGYYRATFTVPDDGQLYVNPQIRYLFDDGGFVYLDGDLVLNANMGPATADDYLAPAANTTDTETVIRTADLNLPAGSATGGNSDVAPAIGNNAVVVQRVAALAPGVHTIAVSNHNQGTGSSDLFMALQVRATVTDCAIAATAAASVRSASNTPNDPTDDTIGAAITVTPMGTVGANWVVTGPAGSAAVGRTGAYGTPVTVAGIPIAEFAAGPLVLTIADAADAGCTTTVALTAQRIIATNNLLGTNLPVTTIGDIAGSGWVFDDAARTLTMNNPGGTARYVVTSQVVDLSGQPDVQFSGDLVINDASSGNEPEDSFVAFLVLSGDTGNPINLISRHDTIIADGVLSDDELAPGAGSFTRDLDFVIPASATSAQIIIEGINNSGNETFVVQGLRIDTAPPSIQAFAGPVTFNNQGTDNPADDTFSAPVTITPVNIGASAGWTSDATPAAGLYSATQPVIFGPFAPFTSPRTVTISDAAVPSRNASVTLTLEPLVINVAGPTNIVRVENGPGFADDTVTFDLDITNTNGGPRWTSDANGVTPSTAPFGMTTFTVAAPVTPGPITFTISDVSYGATNPAASQMVTVQLPGRYVVGQSDLSGSLVDVNTSLTVGPAAEWVSDPTERTLTLNSGGGALRIVETETLDLTGQGEVFFSARLRAIDASVGSNFETADRFRAELIYTCIRSSRTHT